MPPKKKSNSLASATPRPRRGGAGVSGRMNVLALVSPTPRPLKGPSIRRGLGMMPLVSATPRPTAGPIRTEGRGMCGCRGKGRGRGVRPALDSLVLNSYGKA